jgi:two-component system, OmpR family, copper resistance phosphate regulon response regulator CusR
LSLRILIVEDEVKVAKLIFKVLKEQGYMPDLAYDGTMGKSLAINNEYDVVILDLILPGINGLELCKAIRQQNINVPILMLTALNSTDDVVNGLDSGANDYLTKPFKLEELLARVRALGRIRKDAFKEITYELADLKVNPASREVIRGGKLINLTAKEFALLELFLKNKGRVVSKSYISEMVWGSDYDIESNVVEVYVNFLRNKIDKGFDTKLIHTMVGVGYVMKLI